MDNRKWQSGASATPPDPEASPSDGYPIDGNPETATPATIPGARWFHQIGEEIRKVVEDAGLTPDDEDLSQLKQAIQRMIEGGDYKPSVRVASTAAINLNAPGANIDGVAMVAGDRFLEKDHGTPALRGIYVWNGSAVPATRAEDFDDGAEVTPGLIVPVEEGTTNADTLWKLTTNGTIIVGTTGLVFANANSSTTPTSYLKGYTLSNNAADANNDIDIGSGICRAADDLYDIRLSSSLTKRLDAAWAAGTNQGGLFSGSKAVSTWYHVFAIVNQTTGTTDVGFDTSFSAANRPAGYSYRRLGSVLTDASGNITAFLQIGSEFWYKTPRADVSAAVSSTRADFTISVPPGVRTVAFLNCTGSGADRSFYISNPELDDLSANQPSSGYAQIQQISGISDTGNGNPVDVPTNASSQISIRQSGAGSTFVVQTRGYRDQI